MPIPKNTAPPTNINRVLSNYYCGCREFEADITDRCPPCSIHSAGSPPIPSCKDCNVPALFQVVLNNGKEMALCDNCARKRGASKPTKF